MTRSEQECLAALREAADRLGKSPTKAEYEDLDLNPSTTTITRLLDGWNAAKSRADLETFDKGENGGVNVAPEPEWVELPGDQDWETHRTAALVLQEQRDSNRDERKSP